MVQHLLCVSWEMIPNTLEEVYAMSSRMGLRKLLTTDLRSDLKH